MKSTSLSRILKEPSVLFDEKDHTYKNRLNGELYTGCTTIAEAWDKSFFLGPWYAKEMFLEASARIGEISLALKDNPDPSAAIKILEQCKGAARRKGDEAKKNGTQAHDWIGSAIGKKINAKNEVLPRPKNQEAKNAVTAFINWAKGRDIKWLASEEILSSDEFKTGGKLDALAVIDGLTYLVDFKTSGQISSSYLLQCAGYDIMLREMGLQVMGYMIVRIPKDGNPTETLTVTDKTDMQFFRDTFLKQREAHRFYCYMENKFKDATTRKMKVDAKVEVAQTQSS